MKIQINLHFQVPQIHHQRKCHPHKNLEAQLLHSYHSTIADLVLIVIPGVVLVKKS